VVAIAKLFICSRNIDAVRMLETVSSIASRVSLILSVLVVLVGSIVELYDAVSQR
jgi:hypothetical protein